MYWFIDTIVTTRFCQSVHHHKHWMTTPTMHRYCAKEDDGLTRRSLLFLHCRVCNLCMSFLYSLSCMNTFFLKYTSCCCCSTSSLRNMPPATTHLKIFRTGQPYTFSACHLSMQHSHERSDENRNEGGANGLVFSACKLNLPLVPSQDYVLQDNNRCSNKILSDWNFRPPSNVFW
jgi:hypothetical protein